MTIKIGILTRHCYPNYGSILQAYALQQALNRLGAKAFVIDYIQPDDKPLGLVSSNLRISSTRHSWWRRIGYRIIQTPTFLSMGLIFRSHQRRLLNLTTLAQDTEGLKKIANDLDIVIVGSDQVWNRLTTKIDENYLLNFIETENKKFSYAASLGSSKPLDDDVNILLDGAKKVSTVSVREQSSKDWFLSQGIAARNDIDPVLLHSKEFWDRFAGPSKNFFRYILVYQLHQTKEFRIKLKDIEDRHKLPIIRITPDWKHILQPGKTKILITPESFVQWIRDASYMVTDSFHGTAFSLRLGTPLYVIPPGKYSTRLLDLIRGVNLGHVVVQTGSDTKIPDTPEYDAKVVDSILNAHATNSWKYLESILGQSYDNTSPTGEEP